MSRALDILLLVLAITIIYYRYEAIKIPTPKSDVLTVISDYVSSVPTSFGNLQYFKLGQIQVVTRVPPTYEYGDYLTVEGTLTPKMQMRYPKIVSGSPGLDEASRPRMTNVFVGLQRNLLNFRQTLVSQITRHLPSPEAELIAGVLWGAKSNLPPDFSDALRKTGTIHMVVVSGYNISVICALLLTSFSVLGKRLSTLVTIIGILVFTLLTGAEAPSVRAAIMGSLVVVGQLIGRERTALRLLIISAVTMLIVNPLWVTDLGFQLSFLATLGILVFGGTSGKTDNREQKSELEMRKGRGENNPPSHISFQFLSSVFSHLSSRPELKTTLAAQVLTWPLIATAFGTVSLISPVANVLTGWTVPLMIAGGALLTFLSPLSSPIAKLISLVLYVPASFFVNVVTMLSKLPFATVNISFGKELVVIYYLIVGFWLLGSPRIGFRGDDKAKGGNNNLKGRFGT